MGVKHKQSFLMKRLGGKLLSTIEQDKSRRQARTIFFGENIRGKRQARAIFFDEKKIGENNIHGHQARTIFFDEIIRGKTISHAWTPNTTIFYENRGKVIFSWTSSTINLFR